MAKEKSDVMAGSGKKVEEKSKDKSEEEPVVEKKDPVLLTLEDIREHCRLLERSVVTKENRFAVRVLRGLPATRKKLSPLVLRKIVAGFYTHSTEAKELLMKYVHKKVSKQYQEQTHFWSLLNRDLEIFLETISTSDKDWNINNLFLLG